MKAPSEEQLLEFWDHASTEHALDRGLRLLAMVRPQEPSSRLAEVAIAERDRSLFPLLRTYFGATLRAYADCPECAARLEFSLELTALERELEPHPIEVEQFTLRPPTSRDVALALAEPDPISARRFLAERCIQVSSDGARPELTMKEVEQIEAALAAQSSTEILLDFVCLDCRHAWERPFDIVSILWLELDSRARRALQEIHALARAYGWTEKEVLALSPQRRAAYLEMVAS